MNIYHSLHDAYDVPSVVKRVQARKDSLDREDILRMWPPVDVMRRVPPRSRTLEEKLLEPTFRTRLYQAVSSVGVIT